MGINIYGEANLEKKEPVRNAILMAAGMGTRLRPLTENTPKPLLRVGTRSLIETVLDGLVSAGVEKLYVVTGYLGEQFQILRKRYEGLTLIDNPDYARVNNISSVYYAREILRSGDCYICEADLYLTRPEILSKKPDCSCYFGTLRGGYTDDWVFDVGKDGYITRVGKGGSDQYNMIGLSYFTKADAMVLSDCIERMYEEAGYEELFWDEVVDRNLESLKLTIFPVEEGSIAEIDTCEEYEALIQKELS